MSSLLSTELAATCNSLGYYDRDDNKYYADSNTLETAKDLIRFLRRDDETHDIRRQLGDTKVIQSDLLPLLKNYWEQIDLFDVLLRLLVNLTTPALMLWKEQVPKDKAAYKNYLQVEEHLHSYKAAFADETIWAVLSTRLSKILEIDYLERGDENSLIIERILILIRNILYVPSDPDVERRPDNDANIHDQVLWALHQSGMLDIVLYVTSSSLEVAYYMHILEILSFMLREQNATELATAALQRSEIEKKRDEEELLSLRSRETLHKQARVKKYSGTRHSQFGGTFVVKSMQSIDDNNDLIYHKPLNKLDALDFDGDKKQHKTPKNRAAMKETNPVERRSAFSIRLFLKEFCIEFLNGSYNTMMYHVKGNLVRAKAQQHDESYYLWALRFFMEFNRNLRCEMKLVSETMSIDTFHYVQGQMIAYYDSMTSDKEKIASIGWARRLHTALLSYRELLHTIGVMDKVADGSVRDSAAVIKSNLFYMSDYREFVLTLLFNFDEVKMSGKYLRDLLETQHIFTKMLQAFCGGKDGNVVVESKKKARRKVGANTKNKSGGKAKEFDANSLWDECYPEISAVLESFTEVPEAVIPFDATSDVPIDEQKAEAMKNIQRKLRRGDYENAIGLLRVSRDVWPENDCFGSRNSTKEEEFLALREIFLADIGENNLALEPEPTQEDALEDGQDEEEDEEDELAANMYISENNFKFEDFAKRLVHPKVIRACGIALKKFEHNSTFTNHCIVKLLHRIAVDCHMPAMIFQLSIFQSFQKIFEMDLPQLKELQTFAKFIVRQFIKVAEKNKHVYMEALFWKNKTIAYEIEEGYGSLQIEKTLNIWDEASEDELRRLFMEHQEQQLEQDVVDYIWQNIIDSSKTRRSVLKKLKDMYLLTDDYKGPKKVGTGRNRPWDETEEEQLRELYERYKDDNDPLGCIISGLERDRPKNRIIEKMLVMGLIEDKKQLHKKRAKKFNKSDGGQDIFDDDDDEEHDHLGSDVEDDDVSNIPSTTATVVQRRAQTKPKKHIPRIRTKAPMKSKKSKGTSRSPSLSRTDLCNMLTELVESGMSDALEWIRDSFGDALEDLEVEDNDNDGQEEGVPLVPLMEHSITAMDNETFLRILRAMHVHEPADEQETFWRISSNLSASKLKEYCELIKQAIDKTLIVEGISEDINFINSNILEQLDNNSNSSDVGSSIARSNFENTEIEEKDINNSPILSRKACVKTKTRIRKIADSDDESNDYNAGTSNFDYVPDQDDNNETKLAGNSSKRILSSDSDDDSDKEESLEKHKPRNKSKNSRYRGDNRFNSDSEESSHQQEISAKHVVFSDKSDKENSSSINLSHSKGKESVDGSISPIEQLIESDDDANDALNMDCEELLENVQDFSKRIVSSQNDVVASISHPHVIAESKRVRGDSSSDDNTPRPKRPRVTDSDEDD